MASIATELASIVGARHVTTDPDVLRGRSVDHTGRYRGAARALVRPADTGQVCAVLACCRAAGVPVTVQGGRTSLVAGTVPYHDDVLLSTERLDHLGQVDAAELTVATGAGVTLARLRRHAAAAGLLFGVDLSARDSATVGGMAATNAGGLHTVRHGSMRAQVAGIEVVLPDGSVVARRAGSAHQPSAGSARGRVRADNTGYDLPSLWVGSEGTLGVVTALDLLLRPTPAHRATALVPFTGLAELLEVSEALRHHDGVNALELLDGRGVRLAREHLGTRVPRPRDLAPWYLLAELVGAGDVTGELAQAVAAAPLGAHAAAGPGVWAVREAFAEVTRLFGPPVKYDVAVPVLSVPAFAAAAEDLLARTCPGAVPVLFGHVGEGNLHLNVLGCPAGAEDALTPPMMGVIAALGGNVSSEHGVGTLKRGYLHLSRSPQDVAAMAAVKAAFDPRRLLNPAVLFPP